jgi:ribokinase
MRKEMGGEMAKMEVVVIGSHVQGMFMRVPRFPVADETILAFDFKEALDGGKGSHQAIACARLGLPTHFIGSVGRDRLGKIGASWMADSGVDLAYLKWNDHVSTGCGFVMVNPLGIPAMVTAMGANMELQPADIDRALSLIRQAKLVLITFEIPIETALYASTKAKEAGAITILTPGPAAPISRHAFDCVDLLIPNVGEAQTLLGRMPTESPDLKELVDELRAHSGAAQVIVTLGERGSFVFSDGMGGRIPAFKVKVEDTPGAGDAFTAGVAFGIFHGATLTDAARFGSLTAAHAVSFKESLPGFGTVMEIQEFAQANGMEIPEALQGQILNAENIPCRSEVLSDADDRPDHPPH